MSKNKKVIVPPHRGFAAGVYTINSAEACQHRAQIWVVEDAKQLDTVLQIRDNLPHLKTIIAPCGPGN